MNPPCRRCGHLARCAFCLVQPSFEFEGVNDMVKCPDCGNTGLAGSKCTNCGATMPKKK